MAIKMTVYRVGDDTPLVRSLIRAAEAGKQVACLIELKARFDEARNLVWAQELEKVGAHVTYGVLGLKAHKKVALVVRNGGMDLRARFIELIGRETACRKAGRPARIL